MDVFWATHSVTFYTETHCITKAIKIAVIVSNYLELHFIYSPKTHELIAWKCTNLNSFGTLLGTDNLT